MRAGRIVVLFQVIFFVLFYSNFAFADALADFKGMQGTIRIAGGTAHIPVMEELAKKVMQYNPNIQISIAGGGTGLGIKQAGEGLIDIGNAGREPTKDEIAKYGLKVYRWAIDAVAIVVHPSNKIKSLTKAQVKDIYSGKISNWKELGGIDKPINLYSRPEESGTREVFWTLAIDKSDISKKANIVASNGAMKSAVSNDPYAIGYLSTGYVDSSLKAVAFDGEEPTLENVLSGKYKIARGIYSVTKGEPPALVKAFLDLLFSAEGQKVIKAKGLIPAK